jgi:hypothetical protein
LTQWALGMPDLEPVVIDHPVSSIIQEEIDLRVLQIKENAQRIWVTDAENEGITRVRPLTTDELN